MEDLDPTERPGEAFEYAMSRINRFIFWRFFFVALVAGGLVAGVISLVQLCR